MTDPRLHLLVRGLDEAFYGPAWHGPALLESLDGWSEEGAAWRPAPDRHNAWELAVHAAYWKYRVLAHLAAHPPTAFSEAGSNFFARPAAHARLADDLAVLADWHRQLVGAVRAFDSSRLDEIAYEDYTFEALIRGAAAHDVYHAGQIRLLRQLEGSG